MSGLSVYSPLVQEFLSTKPSSEGRKIYDDFYCWMLEHGIPKEKAEGEVATFMETVADLMD